MGLFLCPIIYLLGVITNEPMKNWGENGPREKLWKNGIRHLSNQELLAIILGTGMRSLNVMGLASQILDRCNHSLQELSRWPIEQFLQIPGVGKSKAATLKAVFELAQRRKESTNKSISIRSSDDAYPLFREKMAELNHEEFWAIFLRRNAKILRMEQVSVGGVAGTVVDPKVLFKRALLLNATSIIVAHNHPSGNIKPSRADELVTERIVNCGRIFEIQIFDHLIITADDFYSFADNGKLPNP